MAKITINSVTWSVAPAVAQTGTLSYRLTSDPDVPGSYLLVSSSVIINADGTLAAPLAITGLANNTSYTVKVINNCGGAGALQEYTTPPPTCPVGYTLSPDESYCYRELTAAPTIESSGLCLATSTLDGNYGFVGANIWQLPNYNLNLTDANPTLVQTAFWRGTPFGSDSGGSNLPSSAVNRDSVWVDTDCDGNKDPLTVGARLQFTYQVDLPSPKRLYILTAGDNQFQIRVNDNLIAQRMDDTQTSNFTYCWVIPVDFPAGPSYINFQAIGDGTVSDAAMLAIVDNTYAQLVAATALADLTFLFRTSSFIGTTIDIATCPAGYVLDTAGGSGAYVCRKIETTSVIP